MIHHTFIKPEPGKPFNQNVVFTSHVARLRTSAAYEWGRRVDVLLATNVEMRELRADSALIKDGATFLRELEATSKGNGMHAGLNLYVARILGERFVKDYGYMERLEGGEVAWLKLL